MSKKRAAKKIARKKTAGTKTKRATTAKQAKKRVVVIVSDAHIPKIKKVAAALRARGMKVDSVLEATGMITGATSKPASTLKRVRGVTNVEKQPEEPQFQLPPPDSEVQ